MMRQKVAWTLKEKRWYGTFMWSAWMWFHAPIFLFKGRSIHRDKKNKLVVSTPVYTLLAIVNLTPGRSLRQYLNPWLHKIMGKGMFLNTRQSGADQWLGYESMLLWDRKGTILLSKNTYLCFYLVWEIMRNLYLNYFFWKSSTSNLSLL